MPESRAQWIYAGLALIGTVLPLAQFLPWLLANGPDLVLLWHAARATAIGAWLATITVVTAAAVIALVLIEGRRAAVRDLWLPITATLVIGPSLGLPLFLFMRERHRGSGG